MVLTSSRMLFRAALTARRGGPVAPVVLAGLLLIALSGCHGHWSPREPSQLYSDPQAVASRYYEHAVGQADDSYAPHVKLEVPDTPPPLTASNPEAAEKWLMTLHEAIEIALENSEVVRRLTQAPGGPVATALATAYDPAIAETRIEDALGQFDATLSFGLFWGHIRQQLNNNVTAGLVTPIGSILDQDLFGSSVGGRSGLPGAGNILSLQKPLATGGRAAVFFSTDYDLPNLGQRLFRSAFNSTLTFQMTQPLLRNAGVDLNRTPILIARLRSDQSLWDFKQNLNDLLFEVEQAYWALFSAQVQLWATDQAIELNLEIVRRLEEQVVAGAAEAADLDEAEVQLNVLLQERELALSGEIVPGSPIPGVLAVERQLRGLLGLPPSDGRRIVAVDEPAVAPIAYDWQRLVAEAFAYNPELQTLKLAVEEQRQMLLAARNQVLPQVDVFAERQLFGLGDGFDDSIGQITDGQFGGYTIGVQAQASLGYRREWADLQQAVEQMGRSKALLRDKGREVIQVLAQGVQEVQLRHRLYQQSVTLQITAKSRLERRQAQYEGPLTPERSEFVLNRLLEAVRAYSDAVNDEVQSRVAYNIALANMEAAKGTILRYDTVHFHEGPWPDAAYHQAVSHAQDRKLAIPWRYGGNPEATGTYEGNDTEVTADDELEIDQLRAVMPPTPAPTSPRGSQQVPVQIDELDAKGVEILLPVEIELDDGPAWIDLEDEPPWVSWIEPDWGTEDFPEPDQPPALMPESAEPPGQSASGVEDIQ